MEAATLFHHPGVRVLPNAVVVDGLTITDPVAVQLVRARAESGEDPVKVISDAIEVGARVLDREQAGATVELFRADLERSTRDVDEALTKKADQVAQELTRKVDELFGTESGQVTRVLQRHFGDESSVAVQHRIRRAMEEVLNDSREKLLRQFSSADGSNPLADFKQAQLAVLKRLADQQDSNLRAMSERMTGLTLEVQKLQAEREKQAEVAAEHDRSTAKGRPYEEAVFDAVDAIARGQGDDCDAVGDLPGTGGRKGDVLVSIDAATGPCRGRIVFEAKNSRRSKKEALAELDEAMAQRDAEYGVWVVPSEEQLPARTQPLREINGDKLFVTYDPEDGSRLALDVAYSLARARVLMARGGTDGLDAPALRAEVERALAGMEDVRRIKSQLTIASGGIDQARDILERMAEDVRSRLQRIEELTALPVDQ
jgi:hypothetical protein